MPATPTEVQAAAQVQLVRALYARTLTDFANRGLKKPDMQAFKIVTARHPLPPRTHGHVPGVAVGDLFAGRCEAAVVGVHRQLICGIDYDKHEEGGAVSIVLGGKYRDEDDNHPTGDVVLYVGEGGQDPRTRKQVADQKLERGNLALERNRRSGKPVRLLRGFTDAAGTIMYQYHGLHAVVERHVVRSADGPRIFHFELRRLDAAVRVTGM